jgi:hypothetical protein
MSDSSQDSTKCGQCVQSPWLKLSQAREYLQIGNTELRQLVKSGAIPSYKRNRTVFVNVVDLDTWMRSLPSGASEIATALKLA